MRLLGASLPTSCGHLIIFARPLPPRDRPPPAGETDTTSRRLLNRWGYPYVLEEYRFHMTITGHLTDPETPKFLKRSARYAQLVEQAVSIKDVCLFRQETRKDQLVLAERYPLSGN